MAPRAKASTRPFGDERWIPVAEAHAIVRRRAGDDALAALDLTNLLKAGKAHAMRRRRLTGKPEELPPGHWNDHSVFWHSHRTPTPHAVVVANDLGPVDDYGNLVTPEVRHVWVFSFWRPDLERPSKSADEAVAEAGKTVKRQKRRAYAVEAAQKLARDLKLAEDISPAERKQKLNRARIAESLAPFSDRTLSRAFPRRNLSPRKP